MTRGQLIKQGTVFIFGRPELRTPVTRPLPQPSPLSWLMFNINIALDDVSVPNDIKIQAKGIPETHHQRYQGPRPYRDRPRRASNNVDDDPEPDPDTDSVLGLMTSRPG